MIILQVKMMGLIIELLIEKGKHLLSKNLCVKLLIKVVPVV